ncbi:MAG: TadE family protein [Myxococcaceae bacterium]
MLRQRVAVLGVGMARRGVGRYARARGQAAVETAIVFPCALLVCLGVLQVAQLAEARMFLEYAAVQAARTGAVWSGHPERMRDAARLALAPSWGRTDSGARFVETLSRADKTNDELRQLSGGRRGLWDVEVLSPHRQPQTPEELEFDGAAPLELRIRVRSLVPLKIPLAGAALFRAWQAAGGFGRVRGVEQSEMEALRRTTGRMFLPLATEARTGMQSPLFRRFLPEGAS